MQSITFTHNDITITAKVPDTSVLYMLNTHSEVAEDSYIMDVMGYLKTGKYNGDWGILCEKLIYYDVINTPLICERIDELLNYNTHKYQQHPYGQWIFHYLFKNKHIEREYQSYFSNIPKVLSSYDEYDMDFKQIAINHDYAVIDKEEFYITNRQTYNTHMRNTGQDNICIINGILHIGDNFIYNQTLHKHSDDYNIVYEADEKLSYIFSCADSCAEFDNSCNTLLYTDVNAMMRISYSNGWFATTYTGDYFTFGNAVLYMVDNMHNMYHIKEWAGW